MRKLSAFLVVLLLAGTACAAPRLTVRAFEDKSEQGNAPAKAIVDMMVTELDKANVFSLMERENLNLIADEIKLGQSGLMDPDTAPELGKIKGAQYSMTGAITLYYYSEKGSRSIIPILGRAAKAKTAYVMLDLRIIDNSTGEIAYAASQLGEAVRTSKSSAVSWEKTSGGILASAARDAVRKHAAAIQDYDWEE